MFSARSLANITIIGGGAALLLLIAHGSLGIIRLLLGPKADSLDFLSKFGLVVFAFVLAITLFWAFMQVLGRIFFPHLYRPMSVDWDPMRRRRIRKWLGFAGDVITVGTGGEPRVAYSSDKVRKVLGHVRMLPSIVTMDKLAASSLPQKNVQLELLVRNLDPTSFRGLGVQSGAADVIEALEEYQELMEREKLDLAAGAQALATVEAEQAEKYNELAQSVRVPERVCPSEKRPLPKVTAAWPDSSKPEKILVIEMLKPVLSGSLEDGPKSNLLK